MSTNPNTQQINVFNKGMNTDTSDAYLPAEQYRYAENLRFLTNEGENSGELRLIEGRKKIEQLLNEQEEVKAVTSIRNLIVVLSNDPKALIHIIDENKIGTKKEGKEWFPFQAKNDVWNADHYSLVTRYEDDDNIKLYVADGESPLRAFSIHKGATNPDNFEDVSKAGGSVVFGGFANIERTSGLMKPGIVQYAYILYTKYKGSSPVSPSTNPLSVYNTGIIHKGVMKDLYTATGFKVTIKEKKGDTPYEKILVYRISYTEVGLQPDIDLLYDDFLREEYYTFYDRGQEPLVSGTTFAEFLSYITMEVAPSYIESKNDYLFAGSVKYIEKEDVAKAYEEWDATAQILSDPTIEYPGDDDYFKFSKAFFPGWMHNSGKNVSWRLITDPHPIGDNHDYDSSLQRDELYRYGIILYDKYGNKWPVKHIADIRTPNYGCEAVILDPSGTIMANVLHIEFTISNLDKDIFPYYEIVRCCRNYSDSHTLCQGIFGKAIRNTVSDNGLSNTYYPSGFYTLSDVFCDSHSEISAASTANSEVYLFASPEVCYNNQMSELIQSYQNLLSVKTVNTLLAEPKREQVDMLYKKEGQDELILLNFWTSRFGEFGQRLIVDNYSGGYKYDAGHSNDRISFAQDPQLTKTEISSGNFLLSHPGAKDIRYLYFYNTVLMGNSILYLSNYDFKDIVEKSNNNLVLIYPIQNIFTPSSVLTARVGSVKINNAKFVDSPKFNEFADNDQFVYQNLSTILGNFNFINWTAVMLDSLTKESDKKNLLIEQYKNYSTEINQYGDRTFFGDNISSRNANYDVPHYNELKWAFRYPIGSGGKCIIMTLNGNLIDSALPINYINVVNILNDNVIPYGGWQARELSSVYTSYGNYFNNDSKAHVIYDGDCYIQNFYYNAAHTWNSAQFAAAPKMSTIYIVPVETRIDMNSDSGDSYKRNKSRYIQDYEAIDLLGYNLENPAYMYNTAYSAEPTLGTSSAVSTDDLNNNRIDYRVVYSLQKSNNETTDSWLKFMSANYLDVDTRYGEITDLRLFKNTLMFWLKDAAGVLSVNERTMLQDVNDTNIILGNGDVLQRYDYLTTEYGMAPELMCETLSDTTLYWWDEYRREILAYSGGQQVLPMKKPKTVSALINKGYPTDNPKMTYDHKYHEVLMHVVDTPYIKYLKRFENDLPVDGFENDFIIAEEKFDKYPLIYNEIIQQFTAVYTTPFEHSVIVNGKNYMFENNNVYEWNKVGEELYPRLRYVVNANSTFTKTYDNVQLGMGESFYYDLFYNSEPDTTKRDNQPLTFAFRTIGQQSQLDKNITNREYDLRFAIPRDKDAQYGGRMRGRTMQCELTSSSSSTDFSIQYIITKYRISWS